MQKPRRLAVLIDMDSQKPEQLGRILAKATDYGDICIQHAYGNSKILSS